MRFKDIIKRISELEKAVLHVGKTEKIKCSECKRERYYPSEFHKSMISDSVKRKVCKICVNKSNWIKKSKQQ